MNFFVQNSHVVTKNSLITRSRKEERVTPQYLFWKFWIPAVFTCGSQSADDQKEPKTNKKEIKKGEIKGKYQVLQLG